MGLSINTEKIAQELDSVPKMSIDCLMTGWFSGMDQYVLRLLGAYPQLGEAHKAFANARHYISPGVLTDDTWEEMKRVSSELARAIRKLGNINIPLCERPTRYSKTCENALLSNGKCAHDWHTD